ncbi:glycosyltransferase family 2 protein [Ochrovirga pacifica]|uniref:glycosyltransferase family 2 protein n=1 Tax=Ochrovirga pacifica TaxID=1042376 RepID=UPI0002559E03|nr:glycosyltransferase family 2 protein [Ochrovirga pacifica]
MISVVIPLYNKEHTIVKTLQTVLNQTFKGYEVVVVNDGSTDNSVQAVQNYTSDSRIKIINQENQGVSGARNTGVENAQFNYIAFLDGDDEWFPTYLEKMKEAIDTFPNKEMYCSAGMGKNAKGEYRPRQINKYKKQIVEFDFFENPHVFLHVGAVVVTKKLFKKAGGFPLGMKRNEDFAFLYKAALITQPIYSGFPLSVYVSNVEGQATATSIYESKKLLDDTIERYNMVYKLYDSLEKKNKSFLVFMKYELRHVFMINTLKQEFKTNTYFLKTLDNKIIKQFNPIEIFLLKRSKEFKFSIVMLVKASKVLWRFKGYQRVRQ